MHQVCDPEVQKHPVLEEVVEAQEVVKPQKRCIIKALIPGTN